jgi:hypothetical protein
LQEIKGAWNTQGLYFAVGKAKMPLYGELQTMNLATFGFL